MTPVELHHEVSGPPGAPVVVLSGSLGTDLSMWEPQLPVLSEHMRVVRCDLRGHGASPTPTGPYSIADLGGDLLALLDRLSIERASLCGLSIGGMLSIWTAAHAPARVERLALLCTTARFEPEIAQVYLERARAVREHGLEPLADTIAARWLTPDYAAAHPATAQRLRERLIATPAEGYAACCEALAAMDLLEDLAAIRAPTLMISASEDAATPPEHGRRIAEGIEGARFELVADAAHLASVQQPASVNDLIMEFFA